MAIIELILIGMGFGGVLSWGWVFGLCWGIEIAAGVKEGLKGR